MSEASPNSMVASQSGNKIHNALVACGGAVETAAESAVARSDEEVEDSHDTLGQITKADSLEIFGKIPKADEAIRYTSLSEEDFRMVADELGVEVAAIKAVVYIEAGASLKGFYADAVPVVNFDPTMYARYKKQVKSKGIKNASVPDGLKGYALKEWTQLVNARKSNPLAANMGTFWGMFQIGGFNYKRCGCESVDQFIEKMSYSELEQLQLFAEFVKNAGMLNDLKNKNWSAFARKYNGASYKKRGYHTKMAAAYKKYKALEK